MLGQVSSAPEMANQSGFADQTTTKIIRCDLLSNCPVWECRATAQLETASIPRHPPEEDATADGGLEEAARRGMVGNNNLDE